MPKVLSTAKQRPPTEGPLTVNINVLNDGTVALVFPRSVTQFTASADEMAQLGMNLIKASAVAAMQHSEFTTGPRVPARKL
jgi:hypothetical protein